MPFHLSMKRKNFSNNSIVSGAQAGAFAAAVTCPMDVIKTRIQTQPTSTSSSEKYKGTLDALTRIYKEEGDIKELRRNQ